MSDFAAVEASVIVGRKYEEDEPKTTVKIVVPGIVPCSRALLRDVLAVVHSHQEVVDG